MPAQQRRKNLTVATALGCIALVLGVAWRLAPGAAEAEGPPGAGKGSAKAKARVEVIRPARESVTRRIVLPGDIQGLERVRLHARVSGFVGEVKVDIGDRVRGPTKEGQPGDLLLTVRVPEMEAQVERAKAKVAEAAAQAEEAAAAIIRAQALLDEAQAEMDRAKAERALRDATLARYRALEEEGGVTLQTLDEAEAAAVLARAATGTAAARLRTAAAALNAARAAERSALARVATERATLLELETLVTYAEVRAPFDGIVTERMVDPGAFVPPSSSSMNTALLTVVRVDIVRVFIDVSEPEVPFLERGKPATVRVAALGDRPFACRVSRFAGALDPGTRTMRVAIDVENPERLLVPGTYARVDLGIERREGAIVVPAEALIIRKGKASVFVVEDGKARRRPVTLGVDDGVKVEVRSGLEGDEQVVTQGKGGLADGAEVEAVPVAEPAP